MKEKSKSCITLISSKDGPTSVFIAGKSKGKLSHKIQKRRFQFRKVWFEKHIKNESHTIEEVCQYIKDKYGFTEVHQLSKEYQEEYKQMRLSFISRFAPELLGKYAQVVKLTSQDEAEIKKFIEENQLREQAAGNISTEAFDIDLHMYKKESDDIRMIISVELKYGCISGGAGGSKAAQKQFAKIYRDIYKYYGVTQYDMEHKTERYRELVRVLANK